MTITIYPLTPEQALDLVGHAALGGKKWVARMRWAVREHARCQWPLQARVARYDTSRVPHIELQGEGKDGDWHSIGNWWDGLRPRNTIRWLHDNGIAGTVEYCDR